MCFLFTPDRMMDKVKVVVRDKVVDKAKVDKRTGQTDLAPVEGAAAPGVPHDGLVVGELGPVLELPAPAAEVAEAGQVPGPGSGGARRGQEGPGGARSS